MSACLELKAELLPARVREETEEILQVHLKETLLRQVRAQMGNDRSCVSTASTPRASRGAGARPRSPDTYCQDNRSLP